MAIACLRLVTFFPLRPDFSLPRFISRISRSTALPALGLYLRPLERFFDEVFFDEDFFVELFFAALFFLVGILRSSTLGETRAEIAGLPYDGGAQVPCSSGLGCARLTSLQHLGDFLAQEHRPFKLAYEKIGMRLIRGRLIYPGEQNDG